MKRALLLFFLVLFVAGTYAQDEDVVPDRRPDFIIGLNIMGDVSSLSLGFEKLFFQKPGLFLAVRVGIGYTESLLFGQFDGFITLPHHITVNLGGGGRSFLELGMGGEIITDNREYYYLAYPMVGYRLHPFNSSKINFRAWLYYPLGQEIDQDWYEIFLLPFALSVGIAI
ncbi:MAG: hypothetical protein KAS82_00795 [Bacteroidales bacterium]|nr:hypothetical protein [Bacteroidales bacterium]